MSDCPESAHGHELEYKNNFHILSDDKIAQSCYCIYCGDEMRRIYEIEDSDKSVLNSGTKFTLTESLVNHDPEQILRKVESHGDVDEIKYTASHIEERPVEERGTIQAEIV